MRTTIGLMKHRGNARNHSIINAYENSYKEASIRNAYENSYKEASIK